jgi:hypothetical protein
LLDHWKDRLHAIMLVVSNVDGPIRWMNLGGAMEKQMMSRHEGHRDDDEALTVASVRRWRNRLLPGTLP